MVDTPRPLIDLQALLADNVAGDISAQDVRDFLISCALVTGAGELGGTADAPTVNATHSGSTHSAATDTHIADTSDAHDASAISVLDVANDFTATDVEGVLAELQATAESLFNGLAAHIVDAADAHDASAISILDAANDFTATDVEGALAELQSDNEAHVAAADPHTGYVKENDANYVDLTDGGATVLHSHAGGGSVATDAIWDAKGDLAAGTGADTAAKLTVGADDTILMADAAQATGLKWVASATPSTQAFGDAAAVGTADTFTRGDHKHAMPANPTTGKFTEIVVARWYIDGRLRADAANAQGGVWPIPDYATAGVLVEGEAIFGGLGTVSAGAAVTFDIKHAATYEGARTTIFSSTPSIAAGDSFTGDGSSNDGTIDTSPDYTVLDGGFFWLYITGVGSTAGSEGQDLTVTVTGKVMLE